MPTSNNLSNFLRPISKESPSGRSIRYETIIDEIKRARIDEDESLSQGIWEAPLVKADWPHVEKLCSQALIEQSKDLQVAVWLADAWANQHQLNGLLAGIKFLTIFSNTFWETLHPCDLNDPGHDARLMIYEWFRGALIKQLYLYPITKSHRGQPVNLMAQQNANRLHDAIAKAKNPEKIREKAKSRNELLKQDVSNFLKAIPQPEIRNQITLMQQLKSSINELAKVLDFHIPKNTLSFSEVYEALDNLARMLIGTKLDDTMFGESIEPDKPEASTVSEQQANDSSNTKCSSRSTAYAAIRNALEYLETIEPHSPTPHVLKKVLKWEKQSLAEIFAEFGSNPQDFMTIANFIGLTVKSEESIMQSPPKEIPKQA